jgi:hypothetical protein
MKRAGLRVIERTQSATSTIAEVPRPAERPSLSGYGFGGERLTGGCREHVVGILGVFATGPGEVERLCLYTR